MGKREEALKRIDLSGKGVELGPLFSPIVSKDETQVFYIDHVSTEDLKKKYHGYGIPLEKIAPVDYVLKNTLKETLGRKKFDYVIAAHVIEHIPDVVRWLQDVASILNDGGILSLVIPDKRFTFDILRNESRTADVIGAYLDKLTRPSSATLYDFTSSVRRDISAADVWANPFADYSKYPKNTFEYINRMCQENLKGVYVDTHVSVFTPYSFFEIVRDLIKHDLFDYEVVYFGDTPRNDLEFYVSLKKSKANRQKKLRSIPKVPKPAERRELEGEVVELRGTVDYMTNSVSWRVTKPIRQVRQLIRKVVRMVVR